MEITAYIIINLLLFSSWYVLLFTKREHLPFSDRLIGTLILGLTQILVTEMLLGVLLTALLAGGTLDRETRGRVIDQMHQYTGLSRDFIDKADLRVSAPEFEAELLRDQGLIVGRLDARFTGPAGDMLDTRPSHDPQSTAISSAYTSAFNTYLREELAYSGDREYTPSGGTSGWNWARAQGGGVFGRGAGTPNVGPDLATAMTGTPVHQARASGGSDARFICRHGIPVLMSRPAVGNLHGEDEWIDIASMVSFYHVCRSYLERRLLDNRPHDCGSHI